MKNSKKLLAYLIAAATIGATVNIFTSLSASAEETECCCELPYVSQEEIDELKSYFASKGSSSGIQEYSTQDLPSSVDLSTSSYFPPIGNQGSVGSCAAWATTYYQFTFAANKLNNIKSTESTAYSPRWVYNWLNNGNPEASNGISYANAYYLLSTLGCLTMKDCPYTKPNGEYDGSIPNNTDAMVHALKTRVTNYGNVLLRSSYDPITSPTDSDLEPVKALLNSGHLLNVNVYWYYKTKQTTTGEEAFYEFVKNGNLAHALTIVGYDDNIECDINGNGIIEEGEKGAFKIADSHGTGVHNDGFFWVMYDALNFTSQYSNGQNRVAAFSFGTSPSGISGVDSFHYIEVGNQPVNVVALLDINTSNIYNYIFETTMSNYASYASAQEKYTVYDGNKAQSTFAIANPIKSFNGVLAFDYGSLDEPASMFNSTLNCFMGLHIQKRASLGSTETISSFKLCDNKMNTIATASYLPEIKNDEWFKSWGINLNIGDLNYDDSITADDTNMLLQILSKRINPSDLQLYLSDVNQDGSVSMIDLISLNSQLTASEQAEFLDIMKSMYNSMSIEEQIEYNSMFDELECSIISNMNAAIE